MLTLSTDTEYDVTSYVRFAFIEVRRNGPKCSLLLLWVISNFSGAAFCLALPIGGLLLFLIEEATLDKDSVMQMLSAKLVFFLF